VVVNGTVLWFVLELYRQVATSGHRIEPDGAYAVAPTGAALAAWQALFYATMVVSVCGAAGVPAWLARRLGVPVAPVLAFTLFLVGLIAYPFLGLVSIANDCALKNGFPLGGYCD
jgi:hypothetical protein